MFELQDINICLYAICW